MGKPKSHHHGHTSVREMTTAERDRHEQEVREERERERIDEQARESRMRAEIRDEQHREGDVP